MKNQDYPWEWSSISINPNTTWKIIQENPDKPWDWYYISRNPNITLKIIKENADKPWDWNYISSNPMVKQKEEFINDLRLKIIKSNIIKRYWRNRSYDPNCSFGRKMILKRGLSEDDDSEEETS